MIECLHIKTAFKKHLWSAIFEVQSEKISYGSPALLLTSSTYFKAFFAGNNIQKSPAIEKVMLKIKKSEM